MKPLIPLAGIIAMRTAILLLVSLISVDAQTETDVLSYHGGDLVSSGVNANEQAITPTNIIVGSFEKQFETDITDVPDITGIPSTSLDPSYDYTAAAGAVYAEPLVKTGVTITTGNSQGVHDVVFVATSMDSLYAIDADDGTVLWKDSFIYNDAGNPNPLNPTIAAGITAVPGGLATEIKSSDLAPWVGIVGTPVIDGVNGYIYLAAKTREVHGGDQTNPHYVYTLHKVRLSDGFDTNVVMADTTWQSATTTFAFNSGPYVMGTGDGSTTLNGQSVIYFNALRQMIRPALQLYNGRIYLASGSHGDNQPYHGWILTYDATTLANKGAWCATPNGSEGEGGVWQGGGGVVIDSNGYIYFETGNGEFDGHITNNVVTGLNANGFPVNGNYGDCFVKLEIDPNNTTEGNQGSNVNGWGLAIVDYFSPYNNQTLDSGDQDLGSGGPTLLPDSAGSAAHPHLLVGGGKQGTLYLIDRDNMGKFGVTDNTVQDFAGAVNGTLSVPTFFNGTLYATSGYTGTTESWPLTNANILTSGAQNSPDEIGFPGCSPYITSYGTSNGVVWVVDKSSGELRAYDASNLSSEIWTSNQDATRDALGSAVKFACPTPVNGHVYVGTANDLVVYGPPVTPTGPPAAPTNLVANVTGPSTAFLSWTNNANDENLFLIERSSDGVNYTQIGEVGVNVTSYNDSGLSSEATYYYRVRASNFYEGVSDSDYSNVATITTPALGSQLPVDLYHFDEGAGTSTIDSAGGNNGTLVGTPLPAWITPGRVGNANLSFGGNGVYEQTGQPAVQLGSDLSPILGSTSSLLFWIQTTQVGNNTHWMAPAVTGVDQAGLSNDINWGYLDATGHIGVAVGDSGSVMSAKPINDGNWHHIALSRDAVLGTVNVYVDGTLSATGTLQTGNKTSQFKLIGALSDVQSDGVTFLGANFLNAQLDDVQVYNLVIDPAVVAAIALLPAAPTSLVVTPASGTELDLSWTNNANNATGYEVWSSINGGPWVRIAQLAATAVSYPDTGLTQGTPYAYFVRAVDSAGSADSNIVSTATPVPPATPTGATVTYLSSYEVDLQWVDNSTNESGYNVLRQANNADFGLVGSLPPASTTFKDTTVQPGITYDYHIQAYNIAGYSDFAGLSVTTPTLYQSYFASFGLTDPAVIAPSADPANDGITNLLKYAFALNPTVADVNGTGMPTTSMQNGYMTISFVERVPSPDLTYTVQVSGDLVNWSSGPTATTQVSVTPLTATTEWVTVRDNTSMSNGNKRFIRLSVGLNQ